MLIRRCFISTPKSPQPVFLYRTYGLIAATGELVRYLDVQISGVPGIGCACNHPAQLLPRAGREGVLQVKHGLLPVGVLRLWRCREHYGLMDLRECALEVAHDGVTKVRPGEPQGERRSKCEVLR